MSRKTNIFALISLVFILGFKYPRFRIDDHIKYRLWYGRQDWEFIDVVSSSCILKNNDIECAFMDKSKIITINPKVNTSCLQIVKEKSSWELCDYNDPALMTLILTNHK